MSADNPEMWTAEHLQSPTNRAIHLEQRRAQILPIVDDLRRLAREMEAATKEADPIEGDLPGQPDLRAWHVTRPLFKAADDIERAIADLIAFNKRYQRSYEELPVKRAVKRQAKQQVPGGRQQQAIDSAPAAGPGAGVERRDFDDVFEILGERKGA